MRIKVWIFRTHINTMCSWLISYDFSTWETEKLFLARLIQWWALSWSEKPLKWEAIEEGSWPQPLTSTQVTQVTQLTDRWVYMCIPHSYTYKTSEDCLLSSLNVANHQFCISNLSWHCKTLIPSILNSNIVSWRIQGYKSIVKVFSVSQFRLLANKRTPV